MGGDMEKCQHGEGGIKKFEKKSQWLLYMHGPIRKNIAGLIV